MRKRVIFISLIVFAVLLMSTSIPMAQDGSILARIQERGHLICGVRDDLPGFASINDAGEYVGFDVDICRAVATAILGNSEAVVFQAMDADQREAELNAGNVDMISRTTTWTLQRDASWNATFGPTTFYDGQGIMVKSALGVTTFQELGEQNIIICTSTGSTTQLNIEDLKRRLEADWEVSPFENLDAVMTAYEGDACDATTADMSALLSRKATSPDPAAHYILPGTISKEPLGPLSPQSDPQFADIIRWTVWGLFTAEEMGIDSEFIVDFMESQDTTVQSLLGLNEKSAGSYLGINNSFMVDVITQVGNYAEIFERNLGRDSIFGLSRGINALWIDGGLLYAPPFK
jgi:general L-amino acid transport system substrate-binding protein